MLRPNFHRLGQEHKDGESAELEALLLHYVLLAHAFFANCKVLIPDVLLLPLFLEILKHVASHSARSMDQDIEL